MNKDLTASVHSEGVREREKKKECEEKGGREFETLKVRIGVR